MDIRDAVRKTSEDYNDALKKLAGGANCEGDSSTDSGDQGAQIHDSKESL